MADSLDLLGREIASAREIRALRREVPKVAGRETVMRSIDGPTTYLLELGPGVKVQASVRISGERVASFTREAGPGQTETLALDDRAARQVLRDLRRGYHNPPAQRTMPSALAGTA
jgi:hypothetical protein